MTYPIKRNIKVPSIFQQQEIELNFNSGLTIFVGPNGSGKTQTMKILKNAFNDIVKPNQTRYLSSNRIGMIEQYRSMNNTYQPDVYQLSLGDNNMQKNRLKIEVASGDFLTMDEKKDVYIKVSERLSTLFNREMFLRWENGQLKAFFIKSSSNEEYTVAVEASGLINVISILAALFDDEIKILLIDEPEVSLHPQLQAFLLKEIKRVAGDYNSVGKKMIIMATHSTEMIEINDIMSLTNYIFFSDNGLPPKQISPLAEEMKNNGLKDLIPRLGQIHKAAFFSQRPLLVEGISDSLLCKYFDNRFEMNLGVAGTQIIPVDGKGQFPAVVKLMRLIGKEPIILTDLDAFVDDNEVVNLFSHRPESIDIAISHGYADISKFVRDIKTDIARMCIEDRDALVEKYRSNPYWKHSADNDKDKTIKRALVSTLFCASDEDIGTWPHTTEWISLKKRIEVLFDCLEKVGCFILRRGAIESYYTYSSKDTFDGKPSAAIEEINSLNGKDINFITAAYDDIIRAINYSSKVEIIDETKAIKRELLSELAPILEILNDHTTKEQIINIIKQARGTDKTIFEYEITTKQNTPSVKVSLSSEIMEIDGFPFTVKKDDDVIKVVDKNIKSIK